MVGVPLGIVFSVAEFCKACETLKHQQLRVDTHSESRAENNGSIYCGLSSPVTSHYNSSVSPEPHCRERGTGAKEPPGSSERAQRRECDLSPVVRGMRRGRECNMSGKGRGGASGTLRKAQLPHLEEIILPKTWARGTAEQAEASPEPPPWKSSRPLCFLPP